MKIDNNFYWFPVDNKLYIEQDGSIYYIYVLLDGSSTKYYLKDTSTEFSTYQMICH